MKFRLLSTDTFLNERTSERETFLDPCFVLCCEVSSISL